MTYSITAPEDFLDFARTIKVKKNKGVDPVKAREYMETYIVSYDKDFDKLGVIRKEPGEVIKKK